MGRCPVGSGSEGRAVEQDVADDLADDEGCADEGRPECDQQQVAAHGYCLGAAARNGR